jgi:hypothetical protein
LNLTGCRETLIAGQPACGSRRALGVGRFGPLAAAASLIGALIVNVRAIVMALSRPHIDEAKPGATSMS